MRRFSPASLVLTTCSIIVALVLAEFALRAIHGIDYEPPMVPASIGRYDPELGWSLRPGESVISNWGGHAVEYSINSRGFRGDDIDHAKPRDVFRIVIIGDSNTFSVGVPIEHSYPYLIEGYFDDVEVINLGVSGYGIDQELLLLQTEGIRYQPDLVIAYTPHFNDHRHMHSNRFGKGKPHFELVDGHLVLANSPVPAPGSEVATESIALRIRRALMKRSRLYAMVRQLVLDRLEPGREDHGSPRYHLEQDARNAADELFVARVYELSQVIVRQMQDTCAAHGAGFFFVTVHKRIAESLAGAGIPVLRVAPSLHNERLGLPDGGHKNAAGHGILAWEITRHLIEEGVIPAEYVKQPAARSRGANSQ